MPEAARPGFIEGFQNGAAMVQNALREGRKPYLVRIDAKAAPLRPLGPMPEGVQVEEPAPASEVDLDTGLEVRSLFSEPDRAFAQGQAAGFQWAWSGVSQELSTKGLLTARTPPEVPAAWSRWPDPGGRIQLSAGAQSCAVTWFPGLLAWATEAKGFPPQRRWRACSDQMKPAYVALGPDALWVETRAQGMVALDLDTGAILRTLPNRAHDQPEGYDSYEAYLAAERRKLREPGQAAKLEECRRRAVKGDPQAMFDLARMLVVSDQEADGLCPRVVWVLEAARRGHVPAMLEAAGFYFAGLGVPQDSAEARRWVDLAVAAGSPEAKVAREVMFPPRS